MLRKKCSRPKCPGIYKESEEEFKIGTCRCGSLLIDIEIISSGNEKITIEEALGEKLHRNESNSNEVDKYENSQETEFDKTVKDDEVLVAKRPVIKMTLEELEKQTQVLYTIDNRGYIHFADVIDKEELNEDKLVIYLGGEIYKEIPIEYDETIIGRYSINSEPDVDLSEIDSEGYTSRRHLMIYKEQNKYFARNLSTKNSVHIETEALVPGVDKELHDNDLIILSKYIVMEFKLKK